MAWVACDKDGETNIFKILPNRSSACGGSWGTSGYYVTIPNSIALKIIGKTITWEDEPVELK